MPQNDIDRYKLFQEEDASIAKHLNKIAEITMSMAKIGIANSDNPDFVNLMNLYDKLIIDMENIAIQYERYLETLNKPQEHN